MFRLRNLCLLVFTLINLSGAAAQVQVRFYVDKRECNATTAIGKNLLNAVNRGSELSVRQLLANGGDAKMVDDCGYSILTYATVGLRLGIVKLLIESGADVNAADRVRNWPPLFHALGSNALRPDEEEVR